MTRINHWGRLTELPSPIPDLFNLGVAGLRAFFLDAANIKLGTMIPLDGAWPTKRRKRYESRAQRYVRTGRCPLCGGAAHEPLRCPVELGGEDNE